MPNRNRSVQTRNDKLTQQISPRKGNNNQGQARRPTQIDEQIIQKIIAKRKNTKTRIKFYTVYTLPLDSQEGALRED